MHPSRPPRTLGELGGTSPRPRGADVRPARAWPGAARGIPSSGPRDSDEKAVIQTSSTGFIGLEVPRPG